MLVKALGAADFILGLILMFVTIAKLPYWTLLIFGATLLLKAGVGLLKDFASWIDFSAGIIFILLIFLPLPWIICLIAGILLIQKGIFSFL